MTKQLKRELIETGLLIAMLMVLVFMSGCTYTRNAPLIDVSAEGNNVEVHP
jgi:hypothetical protein